MADELNVQARELVGKKNNRRLRRSGRVPAVLYGHGKENVCLSVSADDLSGVVQYGRRLVDLRGAVSETALLRDAQWDTFGIDVLHVDFTRADADEVIEVKVAVTLRGNAPGTKEGGVIDHVLHEIALQCPAGSIPEQLVVNINSLALDDTVSAGEIELPEGAVLVTDAGSVLVQCVLPAVEEEEDATVGESAEPEVIGRKPDEDEKEKE